MKRITVLFILVSRFSLGQGVPVPPEDPYNSFNHDKYMKEAESRLLRQWVLEARSEFIDLPVERVEYSLKNLLDGSSPVFNGVVEITKSSFLSHFYNEIGEATSIDYSEKFDSLSLNDKWKNRLEKNNIEGWFAKWVDDGNSYVISGDSILMVKTRVNFEKEGFDRKYTTTKSISHFNDSDLLTSVETYKAAEGYKYDTVLRSRSTYSYLKDSTKVINMESYYNKKKYALLYSKRESDDHLIKRKLITHVDKNGKTVYQKISNFNTGGVESGSVECHYSFNQLGNTILSEKNIDDVFLRTESMEYSQNKIIYTVTEKNTAQDAVLLKYQVIYQFF